MPIAVGPYETIVGVKWAKPPIDVLIQASSGHSVGGPGSRKGKASVTAEGAALGGRVVHEEEFEDENSYVYFAQVQFKKLPKDGIKPLFVLALSGAAMFPSTGGEPPYTVPPFCGTATVTGTWSAIYAESNPYVPGAYLMYQDYTHSWSTPGGSGSHTSKNGVANCTINDVGKGASSATGTSSTIWFQDGYGNWFDTGLDCTELPPVVPPSGSQKLEGWGIAVDGPAMISVGPHLVGLTADGAPIWNSLGDGSYAFALVRAQFAGIPGEKPGTLYATDFPLVLNLAPYSFQLYGPGGMHYAPPHETISGAIPPETMEKQFQPGALPPLNQTLVF